MGPTQKRVTLPSHLWRALDDMSKDGAQAEQHLVQLAVEQFVALQGYTVTPRSAVLVPLPRSATMDDGLEMTLPRAQTGGRAAPAVKPLTLEDEDEPDDVGTAQTRVRSATGPPQPAVKEPAAAAKASAPTSVSDAHSAGPITDLPSEPLLTDTHMALKPIVPVAAPTWSMRSVLSDDASERVAARERMVALEKEVARLTIERPTTTPLREAAGDAEEESDDEGDEDDEPDSASAEEPDDE